MHDSKFGRDVRICMAFSYRNKNENRNKLDNEDEVQYHMFEEICNETIQWCVSRKLVRSSGPHVVSPHQSDDAQYEICPLRLASHCVGNCTSCRHTTHLSTNSTFLFLCFNSVTSSCLYFCHATCDLNASAYTSCGRSIGSTFQPRCFNYRIHRIAVGWHRWPQGEHTTRQGWGATNVRGEESK